jgi:hypothetical protein
MQNTHLTTYSCSEVNYVYAMKLALQDCMARELCGSSVHGFTGKLNYNKTEIGAVKEFMVNVRAGERY